jgi:putative oxidoreductase
MTKLKKLLGCVYHHRSWPQGLVLLAARAYLAKVFFLSGLTKINSWPSTLALFNDEYSVPLLSPELAAVLATAGELVLPILLILGLFTPLAALGLMMMTLVIELFVFPGTTEHVYWLLLTAILITHGGGKFSIDHGLLKYLQNIR